LLGTLCASSASALSVKEFRKHPDDQEAVYVSAAVSMLAYSYASNGDTKRGRCVMSWYFGKSGEETPGPSAIAVELEIAERRDADNYHVEGVILGLVDKACANSPSPKTK
jgi:hypothetical protein